MLFRSDFFASADCSSDPDGELRPTTWPSLVTPALIDVTALSRSDFSHRKDRIETPCLAQSSGLVYTSGLVQTPCRIQTKGRTLVQTLGARVGAGSQPNLDPWATCGLLVRSGRVPVVWAATDVLLV